MVTATQRHGELVTDLFAERAALGEAEVMGIAGDSSANEAWLLGHVSEVVPITDSARLRERQHAFVDRIFPVHRFLIDRCPGNRQRPLLWTVFGFGVQR